MANSSDIPSASLGGIRLGKVMVRSLGIDEFCSLAICQIELSLFDLAWVFDDFSWKWTLTTNFW